MVTTFTGQFPGKCWPTLSETALWCHIFTWKQTKCWNVTRKGFVCYEPEAEAKTQDVARVGTKRRTCAQCTAGNSCSFPAMTRCLPPWKTRRADALNWLPRCHGYLGLNQPATLLSANLCIYSSSHRLKWGLNPFVICLLIPTHWNSFHCNLFLFLESLLLLKLLSLQSKS